MARQKKPVHRVQMTEGKRNIRKIFPILIKKPFPCMPEYHTFLHHSQTVVKTQEPVRQLEYHTFLHHSQTCKNRSTHGRCA